MGGIESERTIEQRDDGERLDEAIRKQSRFELFAVLVRKGKRYPYRISRQLVAIRPRSSDGLHWERTDKTSPHGRKSTHYRTDLVRKHANEKQRNSGGFNEVDSGTHR